MLFWVVTLFLGSCHLLGDVFNLLKLKGVSRSTLEYYNEVDNWPMSLTPMSGELAWLVEKYNLGE